MRLSGGEKQRIAIARTLMKGAHADGRFSDGCEGFKLTVHENGEEMLHIMESLSGIIIQHSTWVDVLLSSTSSSSSSFS